MNKTFSFLFTILMVMMSYVSAKAQMSSPFLAEMVKNANKYIGAEALQPSMFDPFVSSKEEKRERFITQYVKTDTLTGKFVLLAAKPGGGFDTVKMEQTLVVNLLNVRKLTGNSAYNGVWAPLYAFDPDMDDPRMLIIMSYKKGKVGQSVQQEGERVANVSVLNPDQVLAYSEDENQERPSVVVDKIITGSDGKQYVVGRENGNTTIYPLEMFLATIPSTYKQEEMEETRVGVKRTATVTNSTTLSQQGDPDLVQQIQSGKNGNGSAQSQSEDEIFIMSPRPGEIMLNKQGNGQTKIIATGDPVGTNLTEKHLSQMIRHNYDLNTLAPTEVTARVVEARNRSVVVQQGLWNGQMVDCPGPGFVLSGGCWVNNQVNLYPRPRSCGRYLGPRPWTNYGPRWMNPNARQ